MRRHRHRPEDKCKRMCSSLRPFRQRCRPLWNFRLASRGRVCGRTRQVNHIEVVSRFQLNVHSLPHAGGIWAPADRTGLTLDENISGTWVGWVWIGMYWHSGQNGKRESNKHFFHERSSLLKIITTFLAAALSITKNHNSECIFDLLKYYGRKTKKIVNERLVGMWCVCRIQKVWGARRKNFNSFHPNKLFVPRRQSAVGGNVVDVPVLPWSKYIQLHSIYMAFVTPVVCSTYCQHL